MSPFLRPPAHIRCAGLQTGFPYSCLWAGLWRCPSSAHRQSVPAVRSTRRSCWGRCPAPAPGTRCSRWRIYRMPARIAPSDLQSRGCAGRCIVRGGWWAPAVSPPSRRYCQDRSLCPPSPVTSPFHRNWYRPYPPRPLRTVFRNVQSCSYLCISSISLARFFSCFAAPSFI